MDALDLLEEQHREIGQLFAAVATAEGAGRRGALAVQLVRAVEAHSRVEERVFYTTFAARVGGDEARLWEAYEHHALLRYEARMLLRTRPTDVRFAARLKAALLLFHRHAHTEEDWMFPKAKRALHDEQLDRLGDELQRAHDTRLSVVPPPIRRRVRLPERRSRPDLHVA
jgi:hemerythrin-like domain-containing protein